MVSLTSVDRSRLQSSAKRLYLHSIGIGVDRLTSRYKIVRVSCFAHGLRAVAHWAEVLDQGSRSWRDIGSAPSSLILRDPVSAAGSIHWKAEGRGGVIRISSFDVTKEEFEWTPCPELQKNAHLVDLQGVLGLVDCSRQESIDVWVMEESKRWMKQYSVRLPLPIALNRWKSLGDSLDLVGRVMALRRSESSWTFYDPGSDKMKNVREADSNRSLVRAVASITLSLLLPAKLWNSGVGEIRMY
ncbi:uncharacterized protein LOC115754199 [Rhodamnia argentea]|uniref:Uncharacterized protein LOC115754199 n=1 Tax=Rhodamnia argentea TaxID=178133 RepID=A0A8B8QPB2_9MYRT|nr:uncharacterized protein LOC115754199 [Rhodamnia argentea]